VLRDVSERKAAEAALQDVNAELSRIARASALGAFAASIAHEVNQPLAAAVIDGETSLRWLSGDTPNLARAARAIHRATDNARRASEVVGRLRAMVVKEQTQRTDFELNKAIGEVLALTAGESQRSKVTVTADLAADEPVVRGDRIQVQQVIMNLVLNAIEAVRDTAEGDRLVCVRSSLEPNMDAEITVEDRGAGVSPDNAERIFDNLFTTKIGGTGLGLPISKSIVEAHGGRMWVENAVPQGAVFKVRLPHGREVHVPPGERGREAASAP
jgi:C4-dicarboxylate-specific signal transduction histidine kinase